MCPLSISEAISETVASLRTESGRRFVLLEWGAVEPRPRRSASLWEIG
jgi:hypothetical protein